MENKLQKIYILQFIDGATFMAASSLSNLVNKLSEGIHRIKCKYDMNVMIKNVRLVELNISIATVFSNIQSLKMI